MKFCEEHEGGSSTAIYELVTSEMYKCTGNISKERSGLQKQFSPHLSQVPCYIKLQLSIKQAADPSKDIHSLAKDYKSRTKQLINLPNSLLL